MYIITELDPSKIFGSRGFRWVDLQNLLDSLALAIIPSPSFII